jgi:hypothetical protein
LSDRFQDVHASLGNMLDAEQVFIETLAVIQDFGGALLRVVGHALAASVTVQPPCMPRDGIGAIQGGTFQDRYSLPKKSAKVRLI